VKRKKQSSNTSCLLTINLIKTEKYIVKFSAKFTFGSDHSTSDNKIPNYGTTYQHSFSGIIAKY